MIRSACLAAGTFEAPLAEELTRRGAKISDWHGRLALSPDPPVQAAWALDTWTDPREIESSSIQSPPTRCARCSATGRPMAWTITNAWR